MGLGGCSPSSDAVRETQPQGNKLENGRGGHKVSCSGLCIDAQTCTPAHV